MVVTFLIVPVDLALYVGLSPGDAGLNVGAQLYTDRARLSTARPASQGATTA